MALENLVLYIEQLSGIVSHLPQWALASAFVMLIALGALSGSWVSAAIAIILALTGLSLVLSPTSTPAILAVAAALSILTLTLATVLQRRRFKALRTELAEIKARLEEIEALETRRFMTDLKSTSKPES